MGGLRGKQKDTRITTKFLEGGTERMELSLMDTGKTFCVFVIFDFIIFKMFISSKWRC